MKIFHIVVSLTALMLIVGCAQTPTTSSTAASTTTTPSVTEQAQTTATETTNAAKETAQATKDATVAQTQTAVAGGKTAVTEVVTTAKQTASAAATTVKTTASDATTAAKSSTVTSTKTAVASATTTATASNASVTEMPDWIKTPTYDCRGCHAIDKKVIGPAWRDVAKRYKGNAGAEAMLMQKVKTGGKGNWTSVTGGIPMTPHPKLTDDELKKVVDFVLSLD